MDKDCFMKLKTEQSAFRVEPIDFTLVNERHCFVSFVRIRRSGDLENYVVRLDNIEYYLEKEKTGEGNEKTDF